MESSIQIERAAADWLAKRDSGNWSEADQAMLDRWLEAATAHRVAFLRLQTVWQQTLRLKVLGAGTAPGTPRSRFSPFFQRAQTASAAAAGVVDDAVTSRVHMPRARHWALAATILLVAGLLVWSSDLLAPRVSYSTAVGGLASVPMSDGSKITLNSDSAIQVAISDTERRVDLDQGEAFFQVAKDPSRPFVVRAGDQRVVAVGTQFSVRRDAGGVRVVVTEGRVRVERGNSAHLPPAELSAGSVARSGGEGVLIQYKPVQEVEDALSWRRGYLVFRETTLAEAVAEFNRYSTRRIVIQDSELEAMRIGGNFRSDNVEAFLRLLGEGFEIDVESRGEQVVLKRR